VAVPTQFHRDVALRLAEAGVHTLVEKPLAFDIGEAEEITAAFEHAGLVGAVGYIERYNPALQEMRRRIADGQLGEIYQIATRRQCGFPAPIADVGVVKDLATHDLDLTAWVSQSPYAQVAATSTRRSGREDEEIVEYPSRSYSKPNRPSPNGVMVEYALAPSSMRKRPVQVSPSSKDTWRDTWRRIDGSKAWDRTWTEASGSSGAASGNSRVIAPLLPGSICSGTVRNSL